MLFDLKNDMEEIWKTVKGYNGYYQVSNTGKVRNPNKVLTPNVGVKNGYVYVTLRKDKRLLHRIVAEINACTLGKRETAGGYIWKKKNDI